jgi:hypothetical protein
MNDDQRLGSLVDREKKREFGGFQKEGNGKSTGFFALSDKTRFTRLVHPSLVSSGKVDFQQRKEEIRLGTKLTARIAGSS